jgi:demethylmenaquinone methyltransferase/2-methoxy-6-polyprenyl-1,4-benzoquinol methylase
MIENPRTAFFDGIADKWDSWEDLPALATRLAAGLAQLGLRPDEVVLDVGCGTGNLTQALLAWLSPQGRVVAVDIAPRMIETARRKVPDARVEWHVADARSLPLPDASVDRVFCYSVWPHFDDCAAVAAELRRVLRPGGCLHVWHLAARERINEIHSSSGEAVGHDMLPPADETAALLARVGFSIMKVFEDQERYWITAVNPAR